MYVKNESVIHILFMAPQMGNDYCSMCVSLCNFCINTQNHSVLIFLEVMPLFILTGLAEQIFVW